MDAANRTPTTKQLPALGADEKRRRWSVQERREIVEETLAAGVSVARVARAHGVNANQVFAWRRLYRRGRLGGTLVGTALVPVAVSDAAAGEASPATVQAPAEIGSAMALDAVRHDAAPGTIHIQLRKARLRIEGSADPAALRAVLEALRG
jgi:transposase